MRKMKLFYKICSILLISGVLHACFPDKKVRIDQESEDYCLFGVGTSWIFQDSATMKIFVVAIQNPITYGISESNNGVTGYQYETSVTLHSQDVIQDIKVELTSRIMADYKNTKPCGIFIVDYKTIYPVMYHSGNIGEFYDAPRLTFIEKKSQYSINGITFNDVKIFEGYRKHTFYWARHIGLIRYEQYDPDNETFNIYNLIRYNVKPYKP